ncbi:MAG TPA: chromate transporter [Candidatus Limnocylindria bacterium]|nr:chromate transporter [Candidatus Limnocylindria bacterium]
MKEGKPSLGVLFTSVLRISAMTFGGGYVIVPLMRKRFASELGWVGDEEMLDMIAIGQSAPGPIAVNTSILLGHRLLGLPGALAAVAGTAVPPLVILSLIAVFYDAFRANRWLAALLAAMRAGVAAVIADAVWSMGATVIKKGGVPSAAIAAAAFIAVYFLKAPIVLVLFVCAMLGLLRAVLARRKGGAK